MLYSCIKNSHAEQTAEEQQQDTHTVPAVTWENVNIVLRRSPFTSK